MALPTGTVTFLFTDVEGSSRLWEQYPEAMQPALAEHDARLKSAVVANGGHVVKMRGDGLHAVFSSVTEAVKAAVAGQRALLSASWDQTIGQLSVRMGIHTGTAELRDGDYYGPAVNQAARVQEAGHGGQVLLSEAAAGLVRDELDETISLLNLGVHRVKDIPRPEHIFQVLADDLRREFPPLRSAIRVGSTFPAQMTTFIGREREMNQAQRMLAQARLVTLIGPGGTGKTRLALQVADKIRANYKDGVWLVELASLTEPASILPAVAGVFSLQTLSRQSYESVVEDFLHNKELLLILDNCEHLIEACAELATGFLDNAHGLQILASSRESLGVMGEIVLRVPPLSLPEAPDIGAKALQSSEAVQLLVQRAIAAQPNFQLTDENAQAIAQICRRLDGIPLALELAAARFRLFTPQQVAERLTDRFKLLTGGGRTAVPRQQTLQALIDWSYDLLSSEEQTLFRRLSVFAGGWSYEAAEAIGEDLDVLTLMDHLVSKSLVQVEAEGSTARYRYLETIRHYARQRLFAAGEGEETRDRHLAHYTELAEEIEKALGGPGSEELTTRVLLESDNFSQAIDWGLGRDDEAVINILAGTVPFWTQIGGPPASEIRRWVEEAMARMESGATAAQNEARRQRALGKINLVAAQAVMRVGEFDRGGAYLDRAISLSRAQNDKATLMGALAFLSVSEVASRRILHAGSEKAYAAAEECLALARELGNKLNETVALSLLGSIELLRGNEEAGKALLAEAGEGGRFMGAISQWQGAWIMANVAKDPRMALPYLQESLRKFEALNASLFIRMAESEIAHIERRTGEFTAAEAIYRETIIKFQWMGHRPAVAHQLECFAFIARAREQLERAARLLGAAEALRASIGSEMLLHDRQEYDREVALLREGMDPQQFEIAWNAGRGLNMDEAVEYALSEAP